MWNFHDKKEPAGAWWFIELSPRNLDLRAAFFNFLLLADGRTAGEIATPELAEMVPKMLREASRPPESTEGEWTEIDE